ncbi:MAG: hydrogenase large subunit [Candidatus Odinarchaeia archaeon]
MSEEVTPDKEPMEKFSILDEVKYFLREMLKEDYIEEVIQDNVVAIKTKPEYIRAITDYMVRRDGRLVHLTVSDEGIYGFEAQYHFGFDHHETGVHIIIKTTVPRETPEFPSVSLITWQAAWAEREMQDLLGVKFVDHPDPRRLFLPYEYPELPESEKVDGFSLYSERREDAYSVRKRLGKWVPYALSPSEGKLSLIPVGPYHPMLIESEFFRVRIDGDEIVDVDMKTGFNHRGIMKLAEQRHYSRIPFLVERVCGICSTTHATAYCTTVESLMGIEIPDRAKYIRTIILELERLHSHLIWFGVAGDLIGFQTLFMWALRDREHVLDLFEILTGNRVHHDIVYLGGVRHDIEESKIPKILKRIDIIENAVKKYIDIAFDHPVVRARTEDIGPMTLSTAKDAGAVGPTARASDWKIDARWSNPYAAYGPEYTTWDVITESGCDVWSRVVVRLKELLVSCDIIRQCVERMKRTSPEISVKPKKPEPDTEAIGKTEAPRGELYYYIKAGSEGNNKYTYNIPHTVRIRTPSYRNDICVPFMLKGQNFADMAIIVGSIDPCFSCTDRMVRIEDVKTNKVSYEKLGDIAKKYRRKQ